MGSLLAPDSLMVDVSKGNHNEGDVVEHGDKTKDTNFPSTLPQNQTGKVVSFSHYLLFAFSRSLCRTKFVVVGNVNLLEV